MTKGEEGERRVFGEIGFISINDLTFTNWFYLWINLSERACCKSVVFVLLPASVLRFIFQYSFISLLWWHTAGGGLAAKTIYNLQSREDAPQILSRVEILIHQGASIFAWSNKVCVWFQTSNRILKLVIRIEKFLWRQGMIGLVTVSVCLIVSECFLWTHQICFLLGPKITLYSNKCLDMVHKGHHHHWSQRLSWSIIDASWQGWWG